MKPLRDEEFLYRAVLPFDDFIKESGKLTSAAFKARVKKGVVEGISVTRNDDRTEKAVLTEMINIIKLWGKFFKLNVGFCREINTYPHPKPTGNSRYHCEIHDSKDKIRISESKCKKLAKHAVFVYKSAKDQRYP